MWLPNTVSTEVNLSSAIRYKPWGPSHHSSEAVTRDAWWLHQRAGQVQGISSPIGTSPQGLGVTGTKPSMRLLPAQHPHLSDKEAEADRGAGRVTQLFRHCLGTPALWVPETQPVPKLLASQAPWQGRQVQGSRPKRVCTTSCGRKIIKRTYFRTHDDVKCEFP